MSAATLAVVAENQAEAARAEALASELSLPHLPPGTDAARTQDYDILLLVTDTGLALQATGRKAPGPVAVDFGSGAMRHRRRGGQNELLGCHREALFEAFVMVFQTPFITAQALGQMAKSFVKGAVSVAAPAFRLKVYAFADMGDELRVKFVSVF